MPEQNTELPLITPWLMSGFERTFLPGYLRKHFHVLACHQTTLTREITDGGTSLVVYCNHASWWDPMLALMVRTRVLPQHKLYAPIDEVALEKYKIFQRMGFYGVSSSLHGATEFLRRSMRILHAPGSSIWITPEGKFCDPRELDAPLQPGLAHLAHSIERSGPSAQPRPKVWFIPAAIEYPFWEERLPECLCWFGQPTSVSWNSDRPTGKTAWQQLLSDRLREAQRELAAASIARDTSHFTVLLRGKVGSWGLYDWCRRTWSKLRGQTISLEHSGLWK